MHSHNVSGLFLNSVDIDSSGGWRPKQSLLKPLWALICMFFFCCVGQAQEKSLSFTVVDLQGKPIEFVELAASGTSSSAVTDKNGNARIRLAPEIQPNMEIEIRLIGAPKAWVFISPWDNWIRVPVFRGASVEAQKIVLAERGSSLLLEDGRALKALASHIIRGEAPLASLDESPEHRREAAMAEVFRLFGLKQDELVRALRLWGGKAKDPFDKAQADFIARNFSKASTGFAEAQALYKTGQGKIIASEFEIGFFRGRSLYEEGRVEEAAAVYRDALSLRENDPVTLHNLALILSRLARYAEAEPLYRRVLVIKERMFGVDHPEVAMVSNDLAEICREQAKYVEAEKFYSRSLAIREKTLGLTHSDVALTLSGLAELYRIQGRHVEAEPLFKRCLAIMEKAHGPTYYNLVAPLSNLALLYEDQGKLADAEPLLFRSLAIAEKAFGPDHLSVATVLNNIANLYQIQGRYAEAEPLYKRDLAITEKSLGSDHPSLAITLNNLAGIYKKQGKYAESEILYKRSLLSREKSLGAQHPTVAIALIAIFR